jgi:hypothetical protein
MTLLEAGARRVVVHLVGCSRCSPGRQPSGVRVWGKGFRAFFARICDLDCIGCMCQLESCTSARVFAGSSAASVDSVAAAGLNVGVLAYGSYLLLEQLPP